MRAASPQILVVEDEHVVALDIETTVSHLGFESHVAHSADEAINTVKQYPIELVLMDIKLKGKVDGIDTVHAIHRMRDIPIIYLTAFADAATLERAQATEPYGYLVKPFQERDLKATVEMSLQRFRKDRRRSAEQSLHGFLVDSTTSLGHIAVARAAIALLVPAQADWGAVQLFGEQPILLTLPTDRDTPARRHLLVVAQQSWKTEVGTDVSAIAVPIVDGDEHLGVLAIACDPNRPAYRAEDVALFETFALRLGAALAKARRYTTFVSRRELVSTAIRDLRAPLEHIIASTRHVADECPKSAPLIASILSATVDFSHVLSDLCEASSISDGSLQLERKPEAVLALLYDAVRIARERIAAPLSLVVEGPDPAADVSCDRARLLQVLACLLVTAYQLTPGISVMTLAAAQQEEGVMFEVRATGDALDGDALARAFDEVWRATAARTTAGLGLFVAREILARHGSSLSIEAVIGKGCRFYFVL